MKRCWTILVLSAILINGLAFAAGPNPPAVLSQSATPTITHQVFVPVVGGKVESGGQVPEAGVLAGSGISGWWLGVGALVVLSALYIALQIGKRRR